MEYSFEELKIMRMESNYVQESLSWSGWEWTAAFDEEVERTGREF